MAKRKKAGERVVKISPLTIARIEARRRSIKPKRTCASCNGWKP